MLAASSSAAGAEAKEGSTSKEEEEEEDEYLELPEARHWDTVPAFLGAADELRAHFEER